MTESLDDIFERSYRAIRIKHGWLDEPIRYLGRVGVVETLPPKGWSKEKYGVYFGEVMRLHKWHEAAQVLAREMTRKRPKPDPEAAKAKYLAACAGLHITGAEALADTVWVREP